MNNKKTTLENFMIEKLKDLQAQGLILKIKYELSKTAYEEAEKLEKEIESEILRDNNFTSEETQARARYAWKLSDKDFETFLTLKQKEFEARGIALEYNKVYYYPYLKDFLQARKDYLLLAPQILRIHKNFTEADEIEKAINTYIKEDFIEKLLKINDGFILAKLEE